MAVTAHTVRPTHDGTLGTTSLLSALSSSLSYALETNGVSLA